MYKYGEKVKIIKLGDPHYGEEAKVISSRKRLDSEIAENVVKFDDGSYERYMDGELAPAEQERIEIARPAAFENTGMNRNAAFERSLYAEKIKAEWKNYINSTDSAGISEEIERAYVDLFDAIDLVTVLEKRAAYGR